MYSQRRNIEILKLRFGDAALQVCEVMLKDMTDSRRLNQYMQAEEPVRRLHEELSVAIHIFYQTKLYPTVISKHFWPALQNSKLRLPRRLGA
jgi:anaphase-promoting complex subunit 2